MSNKPKMNLLNEGGNIFSIMGRASNLLKQDGQADKASEMNSRVMQSKDYYEALHIVSEYVQTELSSATKKAEPTKNAKNRRKPHDR